MGNHEPWHGMQRVTVRRKRQQRLILRWPSVFLYAYRFDCQIQSRELVRERPIRLTNFKDYSKKSYIFKDNKETHSKPSQCMIQSPVVLERNHENRKFHRFELCGRMVD